MMIFLKTIFLYFMTDLAFVVAVFDPDYSFDLSADLYPFGLFDLSGLFSDLYFAYFPGSIYIWGAA